MKSSFDFTNSISFCAFETFSPTKRDLIYDGIQHASRCFKMLDILEMASLDEIIDAKDLISKEVICQETMQICILFFNSIKLVLITQYSLFICLSLKCIKNVFWIATAYYWGKERKNKKKTYELESLFVHSVFWL